VAAKFDFSLLVIRLSDGFIEGVFLEEPSFYSFSRFLSLVSLFFFMRFSLSKFSVLGFMCEIYCPAARDLLGALPSDFGEVMR